jgi:hypothetical protein
MSIKRRRVSFQDAKAVGDEYFRLLKLAGKMQMTHAFWMEEFQNALQLLQHELFAHLQPDAARDADAARWRHVRSTAFREFDSEGMWLRFAAIRHYDGPSDRLNEKFVDSLVDAAMAAGRGEVGT